jgi:hypothetical protein
MDLDSRIFLLKINFPDSRLLNQPIHLSQKTFPEFTPHVSKINL